MLAATTVQDSVSPIGSRRKSSGMNSSASFCFVQPTVKQAPGKPFVFLGTLRRTKNVYAGQRFSFHVPSDLLPGRYRMYLYCRPCGGSLIQGGQRLEGETIRVTRQPTARQLHLRAGATRTRFLISEPAGVVLLLRLTVPHGVRVSARGSIAGLADVMISGGRRDICRRRGAVDVCTQPEEWCPLPPAAWRFQLSKQAGRAGPIRLEFVVGPPPPHE